MPEFMGADFLAECFYDGVMRDKSERENDFEVWHRRNFFLQKRTAGIDLFCCGFVLPATLSG